jgi:hypothetical protein
MTYRGRLDSRKGRGALRNAVAQLAQEPLLEAPPRVSSDPHGVTEYPERGIELRCPKHEPSLPLVRFLATRAGGWVVGYMEATAGIDPWRPGSPTFDVTCPASLSPGVRCERRFEYNRETVDAAMAAVRALPEAQVVPVTDVTDVVGRTKGRA